MPADNTFRDTCLIEGRCLKCRQLVVQRPLLGIPPETDDYRCRPCGGSDIRITKGCGPVNTISNNSNLQTLGDLERAAARRSGSQPEDLNELPINVLNDRLNQAHATLDLIYTATIVRENGEAFLESLNGETLCTAMRSAMRRIEEAMAAADKWNARQEGAHG